MQCKPGDIAVVMKSTCGNEGKLVDVLSWYEQGHYTFADGCTNASAGWLVYHARGLNTCNMFDEVTGTVTHGVLPDHWLLPIKGDQTDRDLVAEKELEDVT
jgi:hypothetical protein